MKALFEPALGFLETEALSVGLEDVDAVCETVKHGAGEAFAAEDLRPALKGQVGGHEEAACS